MIINLWCRSPYKCMKNNLILDIQRIIYFVSLIHVRFNFRTGKLEMKQRRILKIQNQSKQIPLWLQNPRQSPLSLWASHNAWHIRCQGCVLCFGRHMIIHDWLLHVLPAGHWVSQKVMMRPCGWHKSCSLMCLSSGILSYGPLRVMWLLSLSDMDCQAIMGQFS